MCRVSMRWCAGVHELLGVCLPVVLGVLMCRGSWGVLWAYVSFHHMLPQPHPQYNILNCITPPSQSQTYTLKPYTFQSCCKQPPIATQI